MAALVLLATVGTATCGESTSDATSQQDFPQPPDVRVRYGHDYVDLRPWTYCYANACADGVPPVNPPDVGSPEEVIIEFALEDWTIRADFEPVERRCGPSVPAKPEQIEPGRHVLRPAGHAGEYDVTLSGRGYGPDGGDMYTTFRWTTPTDGPLPSPSAHQGRGRTCD
jgi:hypothetical protein